MSYSFDNPFISAATSAKMNIKSSKVPWIAARNKGIVTILSRVINFRFSWRRCRTWLCFIIVIGWCSHSGVWGWKRRRWYCRRRWWQGVRTDWIFMNLNNLEIRMHIRCASKSFAVKFSLLIRKSKIILDIISKEMHIIYLQW